MRKGASGTVNVATLPLISSLGCFEPAPYHQPMVSPEARAAAIEFLTASDGVRAVDQALSAASSAGPVAGVLPGKGFTARRESIGFLDQRRDEERCLFAVRFIDQADNSWECLVAAEHDGTRWNAHGVAGGSGGPASRTPPRPVCGPLRADVFGQWGRDIFYAACRLTGPAQDAATSARLTLTNGSQLSADLAHGLALFIGREGSPPAAIEVFDRDGDRLARQRLH
jgi:hypothetical protein